MIVIKISTLILLFAVHSVSSNDSENLQKFKYKFNHPPQSESYQSIPVAIVYDEPESNNFKLAEKATTYRPRLKLDAITGANMYDEISSIDDGDFSEEEERQVKQLTNLLRKATLRSRANILSDDVTEITTTLQADLEDTSVNVNGFESTEKSNTVYKEMDRNKLREKTVSLSVSSGESINESLKEIEGSEKPQPINRGRQRGQRVRPRDQTEASPSIAKDESSITPVKNEQSDKKTTRRRGSIKYKNYEQYSTATTQKNTNTIPKFTTEEVEEYYPQNTSYLNKPISEKSLSSPERENYPSSEQPQLTNNRPGPRNTKPRGQNFVTTTNAGEESTDRVMIRGYSEEESYQVPQRDQQRVRYLSHSVVNVVGTDTKIKPSSISEPQKYPTTQKPGTSEKISIQQRTKEGIYFEPPTVSLKLKTNKRTTTRQPILTTTEEENYPKLPIVPLQKQLKTNETSTTLRSLTTIDEENYTPQFSSVSQTNEKVTLDPLSTTEDINYAELDINEAITIQPTVTTEEENYPKTVKPLTQYKGEVTNVQLGPTRQQNIYPSTLSPQNSYLQRQHEDVQVQNEVSVPESIDGRVITLKSSFDVATTSSSSLFKPNNKVKVIYKVQNAETTSEDTEEITTLPSMTEENSETTSETVKATEKPFIYENEFIHKQNGSRSHFQNQNATNLPPTTAEEIISTSETVKETEKPFYNKNEFRPQLYGGKSHSHNQNAINLPSTTEEIISISETVETTEKPFVYENELKPKQFGSRSHFQNQNATNVPSTTKEIISTSETVETTEKPFVYENEFKPQTHGSRSHFQNQNGLQIPVSVVYDNTDAYLPDNQRKILRSKFEPANNSFNVRKEPVNDFHESPKTGNVTENLNVEKRTRGRKPVVPILNSENHIYAQTGKFNYRYESGDGTKNFQQGILKPFDDDVTGESVKGGFSYTDKDGNDFSVSYTADENGYRPVGRHLPTPPPIPPAIARALAHLATKSSPDPDEVTESSIDEH